jgi:hypothetical protein
VIDTPIYVADVNGLHYLKHNRLKTQ